MQSMRQVVGDVADFVADSACPQCGGSCRGDPVFFKTCRLVAFANLRRLAARVPNLDMETGTPKTLAEFYVMRKRALAADTTRERLNQIQCCDIAIDGVISEALRVIADQEQLISDLTAIINERCPDAIQADRGEPAENAREGTASARQPAPGTVAPAGAENGRGGPPAADCGQGA